MGASFLAGVVDGPQPATANDPVAVYDALVALGPPRIDVLPPPAS